MLINLIVRLSLLWISKIFILVLKWSISFRIETSLFCESARHRAVTQLSCLWCLRAKNDSRLTHSCCDRTMWITSCCKFCVDSNSVQLQRYTDNHTVNDDVMGTTGSYGIWAAEIWWLTSRASKGHVKFTASESQYFIGPILRLIRLSPCGWLIWHMARSLVRQLNSPVLKLWWCRSRKCVNIWSRKQNWAYYSIKSGMHDDYSGVERKHRKW